MSLPEQALEGVTILDFTQLLQGPYATQMLGDLGANVIKVERVGDGDLYRAMTFFNQWLPGGESPCFIPWNRNKRSLTLNLKATEGRAIFLKLVASADAVLNNLRGDLPAKLGLDYASLGEINPAIVCAHLSAYGREGPRANWPGYSCDLARVWRCFTGQFRRCGRWGGRR